MFLQDAYLQLVSITLLVARSKTLTTRKSLSEFSVFRVFDILTIYDEVENWNCFPMVRPEA